MAGGYFHPLCPSSRARRTALLSESGGTPLLLFLLPPLPLAPCRLPLFSKEAKEAGENACTTLSPIFLPTHFRMYEFGELVLFALCGIYKFQAVTFCECSHAHAKRQVVVESEFWIIADNFSGRSLSRADEW